MGKELENFTINLNQLATITGLHRQTVSSRLANVRVAAGSNAKLKLYSVVDILTELISRTADPETVDIDKLLPQDRKAWFQSERERLKFQMETHSLFPPVMCAGNFPLWQKLSCRCSRLCRIFWSETVR